MSDRYSTVIFQVLSGDAGVGAIIGQDSESVYRIYPVILPENATLPADLYNKRLVPHPLKGVPRFKNTICHADVLALADNLEVCESLALANEVAMDGTTGVISGVQVQSIRWISREAAQYDDERNVYVITSKFDIIIQE